MTDYIGWQINFGFLALLGTFFFLVNLFFLPETLSKVQDGAKFDILSPFRLLFSPSVFIIAFLLSLGMAGILMSQLILSNQFNGSALSLGLCFMVNFHILHSKNFFPEEHFDPNTDQLSLSSISSLPSGKPLGIGNVIGTLTGGAVSDVIAKNLGLGGRLVPVVLSYAVLIFSFGLFGWSLSFPLFVTISLLFISGLCRTASGPACIAFVADGRQDKAGSVIAVLSSTQFFFVTLSCLFSFADSCVSQKNIQNRALLDSQSLLPWLL